MASCLILGIVHPCDRLLAATCCFPFLPNAVHDGKLGGWHVMATGHANRKWALEMCALALEVGGGC